MNEETRFKGGIVPAISKKLFFYWHIGLQGGILNSLSSFICKNDITNAISKFKSPKSLLSFFLHLYCVLPSFFLHFIHLLYLLYQIYKRCHAWCEPTLPQPSSSPYQTDAVSTVLYGIPYSRFYNLSTVRMI